jgi:hypothetical protein
MKRTFTAIAIVCLYLFASSANAQSIINLKWKLAPQADSLYTAAQVASPGFNTGSWIHAIVPGTVFYSYVKAGKEADPDYGENIYKVDKAKYNRPYWYRTEFSAVAFPKGKRIWLNFAGINKRGEVYINGRHIGTVDGLMQTEKYDITDLISKNKPNAIAVLVFTPKTSHNLANREAPTYLSSGSWDWMPSVPGLNSGITDSVTITATGPVTVDAPWVRTAELHGKSSADLAINVKVNNTISQTITGKLKVTIQPGNITLTTPVITLNGNSSQMVELRKSEYPQLGIKDPKLWWPNGYGGKADGTQNLYTCSVQFEMNGNKASDAVARNFGIRKISADTTALNGPLRVYVNDVPVLIKGGSWGMSDYMLKVRGKDYDTRIRFHQAMNFNMIRNWTGEVTDDAFYDYCDKYGIMVWDDFWLNNFGAIDSLSVFRSNAIEKVKRLRDHPSVVIWCGANEGVPEGGKNSALNVAIEDVIKENDGDDRLYLPRSNAGVNNPNFSSHGGSRILSGSGIWANVDPKTYFTDPHNGYLFSRGNYGMRSELGAAAFVNVESFKKFMPKDYWVAPTPEAVDSKTNMWARHYFSTDGALGGGSSPAKYIRDIDNSYGMATSLEDFCKKAQLQNVETTKAIYESWNDHMWDNASGVLLWMSQSAYPSMIWQTYDYYYDLTGAYFGAKTACEPVHIQWNPATNAVKVINNKPYAIKGLTAEAEVFNMDGKQVSGYTQKKTLDANATSAVYAFTAFSDSSKAGKLSAVHFLKLKLWDASGHLVSENFYWIGNTYLDYTALSKMPSVGSATVASQPKIIMAANGVNKVLTYKITNNSKSTAAFGIRAQLLDNTGKQILPALLSDGYFSLMQGETKTLVVEVDPKLLTNGYRLDLKAYNN